MYENLIVLRLVPNSIALWVAVWSKKKNIFCLVYSSAQSPAPASSDARFSRKPKLCQVETYSVLLMHMLDGFNCLRFHLCANFLIIARYHVCRKIFQWWVRSSKLVAVNCSIVSKELFELVRNPAKSSWEGDDIRFKANYKNQAHGSETNCNYMTLKL